MEQIYVTESLTSLRMAKLKNARDEYEFKIWNWNWNWNALFHVDKIVEKKKIKLMNA